MVIFNLHAERVVSTDFEFISFAQDGVDVIGVIGDQVLDPLRYFSVRVKLEENGLPPVAVSVSVLLQLDEGVVPRVIFVRVDAEHSELRVISAVGDGITLAVSVIPHSPASGHPTSNAVDLLEQDDDPGVDLLSGSDHSVLAEHISGSEPPGWCDADLLLLRYCG